MDVSLVEKWLEQGERIEARHLNILKKNQANDGPTDGSDFFRRLYYHFYQLNDTQIKEAIKELNRFQRGKSSGTKGREVVKDFLSNCLILLSTSQSRQELKQYLDKNGKMPIDNSEERRRHEEERRLEQERIRRQQEAERKRREEEQKRRQREQERKQREDEEKRKFEENRGGSERTKGKEESYTAERKNPWSGVFKTAVVLFLIYLLIMGFKNINSCSSNRDSSLSSEQTSATIEENTKETNVEEQKKESRNTKEDDRNVRSPEVSSETKDEVSTETDVPPTSSTSSASKQDVSSNNIPEKPETPSTEMSDADLVAQGKKAIHSLDYSTAKVYLIKAANHGNTEATYQLGLLYSNSNYDDYNRKTAANYFIKAANDNHVEAMYQAGMMYLGIDNSTAKTWLEKAANAGHARAEAQLSKMR